MNKISLFSGVCGIDLAAHWAGIETLLFCEMKEFPQKVIKKHFPDKPIIPDVRDVTLSKLKELGVHGTIDLISAGFPCQPFSHAGKRAGTKDDRYLWPEVVRVLQEIQPTWFLGENVAGLLSMEQSDSELILEDDTISCEEAETVIQTIRADLIQIGYEVEIILLPACAVGSPNQRYRVFILGYTEHHGRTAAEVGRSFNTTSDNIKKRTDKAGQSPGASESTNNAPMGDAECSGLKRKSWGGDKAAA